MTLENDMEEKIRIFYCYRKWEFFYQKSSLDFKHKIVRLQFAGLLKEKSRTVRDSKCTQS